MYVWIKRKVTVILLNGGGQEPGEGNTLTRNRLRTSRVLPAIEMSEQRRVLIVVPTP